MPEKVHRKACDVADRLGLIWAWQGRIRVGQAVEFSLYPGDPPSLHGTVALTNGLRIH